MTFICSVQFQVLVQFYCWPCPRENSLQIRSIFLWTTGLDTRRFERKIVISLTRVFVD